MTDVSQTQGHQNPQRTGCFLDCEAYPECPCGRLDYLIEREEDCVRSGNAFSPGEQTAVLKSLFNLRQRVKGSS